MFEVCFLTIITILLFRWTINVFGIQVSPPKPEETPEDKIGKAVAEYLKKGIKTRD